MPQFAPGSAHVATPLFSNPKSAGFDYYATLCMGATLTEMASASFHLNAGQSKPVPFSITMPATMGTYPVYLKVFSGGVLIRTFVATEDVVIFAPAINITKIKWDQLAETVSFIAPDFTQSSGPHIAIVTFQNPTSVGLDYQATFYLGNSRPAMASASFHLNPGESKSISFSMIWPSPAGRSIPVWFKVTSGGVLIGPFFVVRAINLPSNTTLWGYDLMQLSARYPGWYGFRALDYISAPGATEVIAPFPGYPPDLLGWVSTDQMYANFYWGSSITGSAFMFFNYPIGTRGAQILGMQSGDIIIVNFATKTLSVSPARSVTYPH